MSGKKEFHWALKGVNYICVLGNKTLVVYASLLKPDTWYGEVQYHKSNRSNFRLKKSFSTNSEAMAACEEASKLKKRG